MAQVCDIGRREHAEKLMKYQNTRGGRVKLHSILMPPPEFDNNEKGDALHAMELALSLEKLVNEKLLNLYAVADKNNDAELQDFVEREFLEEQSKSGVIMLSFSDISTSDVNFYENNEIIRKQLDGFLYPKRQKID
ncbi:ferritin, chloroplastic-like [Ipomoea triloba]|uniref:ferritin, chloroplastic-like n=1 Tax=Ipomoea triloba TaxID=35885 RepID=UPI00125D8CF4|nr:ferritin, chloroplastic-like [Ipomoea triloba]